MNGENAVIKICFFINGFGVGGAERQCAFLMNELKKDKNIHLSLMYFFEGENFRLVDQNNITIYKIPSASQYRLKNIIIINRLIKQIAPDIICSWMHAPDVLSFFVKLRFPSVKWVLTERNSKYEPWWNFRYLLRVLVGRFADAIVCNSPGGELYWKKRLVRDTKIMVIPNILYYKEDGKQNGSAMITGDPAVLFAGRLWYQKNVFVLTEVFCKMAAKYKNAKFYIIGEGQLKNEVKEIIARNKKEEQVILLPFQKNILEFFLAADVFVNISLYEGLPNTIIENAVLNKKMVVSDIPEHRYLLGPDFPYYVKDLADINIISETIEKALGNDNSPLHFEYAKKIIKSFAPDKVTTIYKQLFYYVKCHKKINFFEFKKNAVKDYKFPKGVEAEVEL